MSPRADLAHRVAQLRADVSHHKAAIRRHRESLGAAKAALVTLEAELNSLGIGLVVHHPGEGEQFHGRPDPDRAVPPRRSAAS
jgi:hypothetical protein